jgi:hypothetical protein
MIEFTVLLEGYPRSSFFCHPERSEGSQCVEKARFFTALRMTFEKILRAVHVHSNSDMQRENQTSRSLKLK